MPGEVIKESVFPVQAGGRAAGLAGDQPFLAQP
jgi:hypothetical protein